MRSIEDEGTQVGVTDDTAPRPDSATETSRRGHSRAAIDQFRALLDDASVEEVWVNSPDRVFAARDGRSYVTGVVLTCAELEMLVAAMLLPTGRRLDVLSPFVDAALDDGSRLHVVAPGISGAHMAVNIRKFPVRSWTMADLVAKGSCTADQAAYLGHAVRAGRTILVSGATHTGKTTMLRALMSELPASTRAVTCEEVFELRPRRMDVASLQTRGSSLEGAGAVSLRDLVVQALRMRPELVVVGEVRQSEAFDLLLALNSGVAGMGTIHANHATGAVRKLATLALLAGVNVTSDFVLPTVADVVDLVVHLERTSDGVRRVAEICSVSCDDGRLVAVPVGLPAPGAAAA